MAKFKVLNRFKDLKKDEVHEAGQTVDMTIKRADEIKAKLKDYNRDFLERIDNKKWLDDIRRISTNV